MRKARPFFGRAFPLTIDTLLCTGIDFFLYHNQPHIEGAKMPTLSSPTSFETLSKPTRAEAVDRLMYAARMASDDPTHDSVRWHGWYAYQTGLSLPLDLFVRLAESLDWLSYCEVYDTAAVPEAEAGVDHYRLALVSMVYGKLPMPKVGR